jgi:hypothetical protein
MNFHSLRNYNTKQPERGKSVPVRQVSQKKRGQLSPQLKYFMEGTTPHWVTTPNSLRITQNHQNGERVCQFDYWPISSGCGGTKDARIPITPPNSL